jgi:D-glutamate cyclase
VQDKHEAGHESGRGAGAALTNPSDASEFGPFAEGIDRLMSVEINGRGVAAGLFEAARAKAAGPLAMGAARLLREALAVNGGVVFIATGFPISPFFMPEQDGLIGAASLARSLVLAYGAKPVLLVNEADEAAASSSLVAAGLYCRSLDKALELPVTAAVVTFPSDPAAAEQLAGDLIERTAPRAFVAIERPGANEHGHYHSGGGLRLTDHCGRIDLLVPMLRARGISAIAIGDGGNELGCALIRDDVLRIVPNAARCACPCGGTLVPTTQVDLLVMASISNWGAYAIEACLAALERRPELLHNGALDGRIHDACAMAMANNGAPNLLDPGSDAVPLHIHAGFLDLAAWMVSAAALDAGRYYRKPRYPWLR